MRTELHTGIYQGGIRLMLAAAMGMVTALASWSQAPLPPPPPGPELVPPAPAKSPGPGPAQTAKPTTPVVEQLTASPIEKHEPRLQPVSPVSPPTVKPSGSPASDPPTPIGPPAVPGSAPASSPLLTEPTKTAAPPVPPAIPATPASPASPAANPTSKVPQPLSPAVQAADPLAQPPTGPAPGSTGAVPPGQGGVQVTPIAPQKPAPAILIIEVPPQATLWIEEQRMSQTGPVRSFQSPPLQPGKTYLYKIRLSWPGPNGQPITTEHEITVQAGQTQRIDFRPLAQSLGGNEPATITPLTPNPPPPPQPSPPRRFFPFLRPEGSGSQ